MTSSDEQIFRVNSIELMALQILYNNLNLHEMPFHRTDQLSRVLHTQKRQEGAVTVQNALLVNYGREKVRVQLRYCPPS